MDHRRVRSDLRSGVLVLKDEFRLYLRRHRALFGTDANGRVDAGIAACIRKVQPLYFPAQGLAPALRFVKAVFHKSQKPFA